MQFPDVEDVEYIEYVEDIEEVEDVRKAPSGSQETNLNFEMLLSSHPYTHKDTNDLVRRFPNE